MLVYVNETTWVSVRNCGLVAWSGSMHMMTLAALRLGSLWWTSSALLLV